MKRNDLVSMALGDYIVHFDDDDYYSPSYVSHHIRAMIDHNADCVKLSGFFIYDSLVRKLFYWDQRHAAGTHFVCKRTQPRRILEVSHEDDEDFARFRLGYGFSFAYKRSAWHCIKFPDVSFCEDLYFMTEAAKTKSILLLPDNVGICVHFIHCTNMSGCFPQYMIPPFILRVLFPDLTTEVDAGG